MFKTSATGWVRFLLLVGIALSGLPAQAQDRPVVHLNQALIEAWTARHAVDLKDPIATFAVVFESLPERVKVYPTENYFYYAFVANGEQFQGNLRLDPRDRDQGKVHFDFFDSPSAWSPESRGGHSLDLDQSHGVTVERAGPLLYRVSFRGKTVEFALNDLSAVKPPPTATHAGERYLGPIFDESGIRFFFLYNQLSRVFHYVLDETVPVADALKPMPRFDRILVGQRTGFVFYRDHRLERKILIGAHNANVEANNYFDGPFDQLPENFFEGDAYRDAIIHADPSQKGRIDRLGHFTDGEEGRYLVDPYIVYRNLREVTRVHTCAAARVKREREYYRCFHNPTR